MHSFYKNKKPGKQRVFRKRKDAKKGERRGGRAPPPNFFFFSSKTTSKSATCLPPLANCHPPAATSQLPPASLAHSLAPPACCYVKAKNKKLQIANCNLHLSQTS
jgi:hypothetical protein